MSIIEKVIKTQEFATLPTVAMRILEIIEKDNVNTNDIARIIESDPSLTLKLLRVANSPLYASRAEVNSISQAILTLGLNRLTNIVLGVSIFSKFIMSSKSNVGELIEKFWWHASSTGIVAKVLANYINKNFKEKEFIGGLIHDIGKLSLMQYDPDKYKEVIRIVNFDRVMDIEAETQVFGANHIEVGTAIAQIWKLPSDLIEAIEFHSKPHLAPNHKALVSTIRVADLLCEMWGAGFYEGVDEIVIESDFSWQTLKQEFPELADVDFEKLTFDLEVEFNTAHQFLDMISH